MWRPKVWQRAASRGQRPPIFGGKSIWVNVSNAEITTRLNPSLCCGVVHVAISTTVLRQGGASAFESQQRRNPALAWSTLSLRGHPCARNKPGRPEYFDPGG